MKTSCFSRPVSDSLKGIALIFMFIHHFFTCPEWYVDAVAYPQLTAFARYFFAPFKLCVPVFAFLTGYFYYFNRQKDLRYSLRKITDLLISHWAVCIPMMLLAVSFGCWEFTFSGFIIEMIGLGESIMMFSWYVIFYCCVLLMLPVLDLLSTDSLAGDVLLLLIMPVAAVVCVVTLAADQFHLDSKILFSVLNSIREWFPCVISGYFFAKYDLFAAFPHRISSKISQTPAKLLFWLGLCLVGFGGRLALPRFQLGAIQTAGTWKDIAFTMDIFYAPAFLYGAKQLLEWINRPLLFRILGEIGRKSLYMWFLHAMFFNACREFLQPLVYFPRNPIAVLLLSLTVCYCLAALFDAALRPVLKWKTKLL